MIHEKVGQYSIHIDATDQELLALGQAVAKAHGDHIATEIAKKEAAEEFKDKLTMLESQIQSMVEQIQSRRIYIPQAPCREYWDTDNEHYSMYFGDRLIGERSFTEEEKCRFAQNIFDIDEPTAPRQNKTKNNELMQVYQEEKSKKHKKDHTL